MVNHWISILFWGMWGLLWVISQLYDQRRPFSGAKLERRTRCPEKTQQHKTCLQVDTNPLGRCWLYSLSPYDLRGSKCVLMDHLWQAIIMANTPGRTLPGLLCLKHHQQLGNTYYSRYSSNFQPSVDEFPIQKQSSLSFYGLAALHFQPEIPSEKLTLSP